MMGTVVEMATLVVGVMGVAVGTSVVVDKLSEVVKVAMMVTAV